MFSLLQSAATADARDRLVIAPHHPDRLGRPAARPADVEQERFRQALTWNVFRTLELLPPGFWLRRFHARLTGGASTPAAQTARISLWQFMPLPPVQRLDGARAPIPVDVIIETEHAVWTLVVAHAHARLDDDDRMSPVVDAGAWLSGAREHYCGVVDAEISDSSYGGLTKRRYTRSRESSGLRSATRGPARPRPAAACGAIRWTELAAILRECEDARSLTAIERALAHNAVSWLQEAGVEAAAPLSD
jgi:hypothetical protein